jgi:broad specificity phosphatase PhoE
MRHGADQGTQLEKFEDMPLSIEGKAQVNKALNVLKKYTITSIYSSPMKRTRETAEIVSKELNLEANIDNDLRDRNLGKAQGLTFAEVRKIYANLLSNNTFQMDFKFPDGESNFDVYERAANFLTRINRLPDGKSEGIVVVSHPLILNYLIYNLHGIGFKDCLLYVFEPATIAVIQLQDTYYQLLEFI